MIIDCPETGSTAAADLAGPVLQAATKYVQRTRTRGNEIREMKRPNRVFQRALIGGLIGFVIFAGATDYFIQGIPEKAMPGPGGFMGPYFLGPAIGSVLGVLSGTLSPKRSTDTEDKN